MKINKFLTFGIAMMGLVATSCVGDLDLEPIDPNLESPSSATLLYNEAMECYQIMATSGNDGPASSIISGLDNGRGQYTRAIFMMNEFPTDEVIWIWKDDGIYDLVTNTFDATNGNIYGTYSRLFAHIAVCNQFITDAEGNSDPEIQALRDEVRTLRAMSYYWMIDIFGKSSFTTSAPDGSAPGQVSREELYSWLEKELIDLADNSKLKEKLTANEYGRVGKDAAEALLARLYLNAGVYTGTPAWDKCAVRCENIINRHKGGGFKGSGLVNEYLHLFCRDAKDYMPGGKETDQNEILWGIPFDSDRLQSYGGTTFLIASAVANEGGVSGLDYGCSSVWKCTKAVKEFSERFTDNDKRWSLWVRGNVEYKNTNGETETKEYKITNDEYGQWGDGYLCIKWTGLSRGNDFFPPHHPNNPCGNIFSSNVTSTAFGGTDLALIRLADVYLMYSEAALNGGGDMVKGLEYVNLIRSRAGVSEWDSGSYTPENLLDERCRELYWEMTRRSDLVRFGKFTGTNQLIWSWKGNDLNGNAIANRYDIMPIPANVLASQPDFEQNTGY